MSELIFMVEEAPEGGFPTRPALFSRFKLRTQNPELGPQHWFHSPHPALLICVKLTIPNSEFTIHNSKGKEM